MEGLKANIVNAALDVAVALMKDQTDPMAARRAALQERLTQTEKQLANLANTIADLGGSPAIVAAMKAREAERQRLLDELAPLAAMADRTASWTDATLRHALRARLDDWRELMEGHVEEARRVLDAALGDRLTFSREPDGTWTISMPLAWDRVLERLSPEAFAGLQLRVASPNALSQYLVRVFRGPIARAA